MELGALPQLDVSSISLPLLHAVQSRPRPVHRQIQVADDLPESRRL